MHTLVESSSLLVCLVEGSASCGVKNHKRVIAIRRRGPLPRSGSMGQRHWRDYEVCMAELLGLLTLADAEEWEYMMIRSRYCKSLLHLIL